MPAKRKATSKKKGQINLSILLIIVILIAILSYAVSYLFINNTSKKEVVTNQRNESKVENTNNGNISVKSPLDGSWYSTYDGTILTISGSTFKMELAGVDKNEVTHGSILVKKSEIIIMYDSSSKICIDKPGKYSWNIKDSASLNLVKINDPCTSRVARMTAGWEKF